MEKVTELPDFEKEQDEKVFVLNIGGERQPDGSFKMESLMTVNETMTLAQSYEQEFDKVLVSVDKFDHPTFTDTDKEILKKAIKNYILPQINSFYQENKTFSFQCFGYRTLFDDFKKIGIATRICYVLQDSEYVQDLLRKWFKSVNEIELTLLDSVRTNEIWLEKHPEPTKEDYLATYTYWNERSEEEKELHYQKYLITVKMERNDRIEAIRKSGDENKVLSISQAFEFAELIFSTKITAITVEEFVEFQRRIKANQGDGIYTRGGFYSEGEVPQ
jgi:hypothetical protein